MRKKPAHKKKNVILAVAAAVVIIVLIIVVKGGNNTVETVADNSASEETTDTSRAQREVKKTAVLNISSKSGDYTGHAEGDFFVIDYCGIDADTIKVPDTIDGLPVKKLGKLSFARRFCKNIILPDSVEEIGERAFINCEGLEKISFGEGLKKIGSEALKSCHALKEVAFPKGMSEIGDNVFSENEKLTRINIPGKKTRIGSILEEETCPKAVLITPSDSKADKIARENELPVRNK